MSNLNFISRLRELPRLQGARTTHCVGGALSTGIGVRLRELLRLQGARTTHCVGGALSTGIGGRVRTLQVTQFLAERGRQMR